MRPTSLGHNVQRLDKLPQLLVLTGGCAVQKRTQRATAGGQRAARSKKQEARFLRYLRTVEGGSRSCPQRRPNAKWRAGESLSLERGVEAKRETARRADGVAGEQAAEIDELQHVGKILPVRLQANVQSLGPVHFAARGRADHQGRVNPAARKINAIEDCLAVFRQHLRRVSVKFEREAGTVLNSAGDPQARFQLISPARE